MLIELDNLLVSSSVNLTYTLSLTPFLFKIVGPPTNILLQEILVRIFVASLIIIGIIFLVYFTGNILLNVKMEEAKHKEDYYNKIEENQKKVREIRHNIVNQIIILKITCP